MHIKHAVLAKALVLFICSSRTQALCHVTMVFITPLPEENLTPHQQKQDFFKSSFNPSY